MAHKQLVAPKHITRPPMAREIVAWHRHLDVSAWIMATGRERLCAKGKLLWSVQPRQDVFDLVPASLTQIVGIYKSLYNVDLSVK